MKPKYVLIQEPVKKSLYSHKWVYWKVKGLSMGERENDSFNMPFFGYRYTKA